MIYIIDHNDSFTHNVVHQFSLYDKVECDNYNEVCMLKGMTAGATGTIQLVNYTPDFLEYEANLSAEGLGVFSEIWYPEGWVARIDGEPAETLRAKYVLRALKVPAGQHSITWEYEIERSSWMDVLFNLLLLLFVLGAAWWGWKESNDEIDGHAERA